MAGPEDSLNKETSLPNERLEPIEENRQQCESNPDDPFLPASGAPPVTPPPPLPSEEFELRRIERMMFQATGGIGSGHPLHDKLTDKHISSILTNEARHSERQHDSQKDRTRAIKETSWIAMAVVLILCWMFLAYGKSDTLVEVLKLVIPFVLGLAGGYGLGKSAAKQQED